jgi:caffeoyl-CoA O-methyltransferase
MDQTIAGVIESCQAFMRDKADALSLPRESAEFVYGLILAVGAKRALEIGTSYGHSGLWIGAAMQTNGGTVVTIDRERRKSEIAAAYFAQAGLSSIIRCENGLALEVIKSLRGPIDFVLNDADKENCRAYVELLLPKLAPRAVVLTDNTISHAAQLADFVCWMRQHPAFAGAHVPVGNGMEMSVRR